MYCKIIFGFIVLIKNVVSNDSTAACNTTIEFGVNTEISISQPSVTSGTSVSCWYKVHRATTANLDIFYIDVDRFHVGKLVENECIGGYLRILDSQYEVVNDHLGYHCGEIEQPKLIVRETKDMELFFHVDHWSRNVEWVMRVKLVRKWVQQINTFFWFHLHQYKIPDYQT